QLLESELFGHEKGAFTGAQEMRKGRFELAHGGTLLLDEISEMDLGLQSKLLRVLQEMAFERVGSSVTRKVDVRVVATTNRNLKEEASAGRFRQDLYFRLAVIPIQVPALRERKQDIPELAAHYLEKLQTKLGRPHKLLPQAHDLLVKYSWPGNVRELFNVLERAAILNPDENIGPEQLAPMLEMSPSPNLESGTPIDQEITIEEMEQQLILSTLDRLHGHKTNAAKSLGITVKTLRNKLGRWGIDR
ncbi:MAG: sigma-54 dependent transcriptional regulator, partial [Planctomycetota bacterium]|nr:sigma-54 dependent transcriptional regulator [Planctomycetota bacterium]